MKRLLSLCLVLSLLLGMTGAFAAKAAFTDVPENAWYFEPVQQFTERGLVKGVSETKFHPGGTMTRAMALTILWRWSGSREMGKSSFRDVPENSWFAEAAAWGAQQGYVNGVGEGLFRPDTPITREQLAAMLYRIAEADGVEVNYVRPIQFTEDDPVSPWAVGPMRLAITGDIIKGRGTADGIRWDAKSTCTRAEAVTMLYRFAEIYPIMPLRRHLENDVLSEDQSNAIAEVALQLFAAALEDGRSAVDTVSPLLAEPPAGLEAARNQWRTHLDRSEVEGLNPLRFRGQWANPVGPSDTGRNYAQAQIYLENENCTGFRLQVLGAPFALAVLVPNEGVTPESLLDALDGQSLRQLLLGNEYDLVHATFPSFTVSDGEAVLAVTGAGINMDGGPDDAVEETYTLDDDIIRGTIVHADRPFVYILMDTATNLPMFIGITQ